MRVRKKLIVLHTLFSLVLALTLLAAMRSAVQHVIAEAEREHASMVLMVLAAAAREGKDPIRVAEALQQHSDQQPRVLVEIGAAADLGIDPATAAQTELAPWSPRSERGRVIAWAPAEPGAPRGETGRFLAVRAEIPAARDAVMRLYVFMSLALLAVYGVVAIALETLVLPQSVYEPIRRLLRADRAVQEGRAEDELVPESAIPADELGEIMRSRNDSIRKLREQESALARALDQLEAVATDLRRKNHLLETAKRNLADADRLASLGMMSAGLAHELNTPLGVLKGLVERIERDPEHRTDSGSAALMSRVVARLERLSDSLLDFARAREPGFARVELAPIVEEAITLVRLDRGAERVAVDNHVEPGVATLGDADRLLQVLVNIIRNAADALVRSGRGGRVTIDADTATRDGETWVSLAVSDDGPGIDPGLLSILFEPFVSTGLDSRGTGLGLAVAEGIVREHGGVILARNRSPGPGAMFEILLPAPPDAHHAPGASPADAGSAASCLLALHPRDRPE